jgi:predicted nucleotidyltransferase
MKPSETFKIHREKIREIVESNRGLNPRVFGSVLHDTDTEVSDLDILIDAGPRFTLFDMARIALEIEKLTKTKVDVLTADDISPKYRPKVIAEARPL